MKNNLVKILATLGLIVAIALVLKGVFGVGKIGIKNLSSKTYIKFDRCYPPDEYKNFNEYFLDDWNNDWEEAYWEIDLEKNVVISTGVWKDKALKEFKEKFNKIVNKYRVDTYPIASSSKTYVQTAYITPDWNEMRHKIAYVFDLKKGYLESTNKEISGKIFSTNKMHCEKY